MKTCETHEKSLLTVFVRYEAIDYCTGRTVKSSLNSTSVI